LECVHRYVDEPLPLLRVVRCRMNLTLSEPEFGGTVQKRFNRGLLCLDIVTGFIQCINTFVYACCRLIFTRNVTSLYNTISVLIRSLCQQANVFSVTVIMKLGAELQYLAVSRILYVFRIKYNVLLQSEDPV
jgi:hypothetical protein